MTFEKDRTRKRPATDFADFADSAFHEGTIGHLAEFQRRRARGTASTHRLDAIWGPEASRCKGAKGAKLPHLTSNDSLICSFGGKLCIARTQTHSRRTPARAKADDPTLDHWIAGCQE